MALFGDSTQTTTSTAPWTGAQPFLKQVMGGAQSAYQTNTGYGTPPIQDLYTPYSAQTNAALGNLWNVSQANSPMAAQLAQTPGALAGYMPGGAMANQYQSLYNQASNPYFAQALQNQVDLTANDVQRQFGSMGRIGSAADTGALTQQLGQLRTGALANQWNQNIQNQMGILSGLTGAQMNAVNAMPGAYSAQMLPEQYMAQVGSAYDQQNKAQAAAQLQQFQTTQQAPWERLNAYSNMVGGGSLNRAASTQVPSNPFGTALGGALSGASMLGGAGSIFGIPGAAFGALGGAGLGFLSGLP